MVRSTPIILAILATTLFLGGWGRIGLRHRLHPAPLMGDMLERQSFLPPTPLVPSLAETERHVEELSRQVALLPAKNGRGVTRTLPANRGYEVASSTRSRTDLLLAQILAYGPPMLAALLFAGALGIPLPGSLLVLVTGAFIRQELLTPLPTLTAGLMGVVEIP